MGDVRRQPMSTPKGYIYVHDTDRPMMEAAVSALYFGFGPEKVRGTTEVEAATDWMVDGHPSVLVTGVENSASLICEARSRFPDLPIVLLSPDAEDEVELSECVRLLPSDFGDEAIRNAIHELIPGRTTPKLGRRNPSTTLLEVLQLLLSAGNRGRLEVHDIEDGETGEISVRGDTIIDGRVEGGDATGLAALLEMSRWERREFRWTNKHRDAITMNIKASELFRHMGGGDDSNEDGSGAGAVFESTLDPFDSGSARELGRRESAAKPFVASPDIVPVDEAAGRASRVLTVPQTLAALSDIRGFIAAALVDAGSGRTLGTLSGDNDFDVEAAAATNTDVVNAKMRAVQKLELEDTIEDILITLDEQYHLIRPLGGRPEVFFYLALERGQSNLAMARMSLGESERSVML